MLLIICLYFECKKKNELFMKFGEFKFYCYVMVIFVWWGVKL